MSLPVPPSKVSSPLFPFKVSSPSPPFSTSLALFPLRVSFPPSPLRVSAPPFPWRISSPSPPLIVSAPPFPVRLFDEELPIKVSFALPPIAFSITVPGAIIKLPVSPLILDEYKFEAFFSEALKSIVCWLLKPPKSIVSVPDPSTIVNAVADSQSVISLKIELVEEAIFVLNP